MQELTSIVKPDIGILTGVDKVHATYFPDASAIFDEKVQLLDATRDVVFYGYPLHELIENRQFTADVLSFALHEDENETDI
jgi:UDP-N-acetylmuramyl pentapeptide synthase